MFGRLSFALFVGLYSAPLGEGFAFDSKASNPIEAFLTPLRGRPFILELPELDDLNRSLPVTLPWVAVQANEQSYDTCLKLLRATEPPAVGLFDRYGNCLVRSTRGGLRSGSRLKRLLGEFDEQQKKLKKQLARLERDAVRYEERDDYRRAVEKFLNLTAATGMNGRVLNGYPEIVRARAALTRLDQLLRVRLYQLMARERELGSSKLKSRLADLHEEAKGLPVAREIARREAVLEAGLTAPSETAK